MMKIKVFHFKKMVSFIISLIFLFNSTFYNLYAMLGGSNLPISSYGQIIEKYDGTSSGKIILIKDLHKDYEVEKNILKFLENLKKDYKDNFKFVGIEGVDQKGITFNTFAKFKKSEKEDILDKMAHLGYLSGAEWFAALNNINVVGLEDRDLYLKNFKNYYKSVNYREDLANFFDEINRGIARNEAIFFTQETKNLLEARLKFLDGKISLKEYGLFLEPNIKPENLMSFTNYKNQIILEEKKKEIFLNEIKYEASDLIQKLENYLKKDEKEALNKIDGDEFYLLLAEILKQKNINIKNYKKLSEYLEYLELKKNVDLENLYFEIEEMEKEAFLNLEKNRKDSSEFLKAKIDLLDIERFLFNKVGNFEQDKISEEIDEKLETSRKFFKKLFYKDYFENYYEKLKLSIKNMKLFYRDANKRNEIMSNNILFSPLKKGEIRAIVLGGYHTDGVKNLFKAKGINYEIVLPNFLGERTNLYEKRIKEQGERFYENLNNAKFSDLKNDQLELVSLFANSGLDLNGNSLEDFVILLLSKEKNKLLEEKYNTLSSDLKFIINLLAFYDKNQNLEKNKTEEENKLIQKINKLKNALKNLGINFDISIKKDEDLIKNSRYERLKTAFKEIFSLPLKILGHLLGKGNKNEQIDKDSYTKIEDAKIKNITINDKKINLYKEKNPENSTNGSINYNYDAFHAEDETTENFSVYIGKDLYNFISSNFHTGIQNFIYEAIAKHEYLEYQIQKQKHEISEDEIHIEAIKQEGSYSHKAIVIAFNMFFNEGIPEDLDSVIKSLEELVKKIYERKDIESEKDLISYILSSEYLNFKNNIQKAYEQYEKILDKSLDNLEKNIKNISEISKNSEPHLLNLFDNSNLIPINQNNDVKILNNNTQNNNINMIINNNNINKTEVQNLNGQTISIETYKQNDITKKRLSHLRLVDTNGDNNDTYSDTHKNKEKNNIKYQDVIKIKHVNKGKLSEISENNHVFLKRDDTSSKNKNLIQKNININFTNKKDTKELKTNQGVRFAIKDENRNIEDDIDENVNINSIRTRKYNFTEEENLTIKEEKKDDSEDKYSEDENTIINFDDEFEEFDKTDELLNLIDEKYKKFEKFVEMIDESKNIEIEKRLKKNKKDFEFNLLYAKPWYMKEKKEKQNPENSVHSQYKEFIYNFKNNNNTSKELKNIIFKSALKNHKNKTKNINIDYENAPRPIIDTYSLLSELKGTKDPKTILKNLVNISKDQKFLTLLEKIKKDEITFDNLYKDETYLNFHNNFLLLQDLLENNLLLPFEIDLAKKVQHLFIPILKDTIEHCIEKAWRIYENDDFYDDDYYKSYIENVKFLKEIQLFLTPAFDEIDYKPIKNKIKKKSDNEKEITIGKITYEINVLYNTIKPDIGLLRLERRLRRARNRDQVLAILKAAAIPFVFTGKILFIDLPKGLINIPWGTWFTEIRDFASSIDWRSGWDNLKGFFTDTIPSWFQNLPFCSPSNNNTIKEEKETELSNNNIVSIREEEKKEEKEEKKEDDKDKSEEEDHWKNAIRSNDFEAEIQLRGDKSNKDFQNEAIKRGKNLKGDSIKAFLNKISSKLENVMDIIKNKILEIKNKNFLNKLNDLIKSLDGYEIKSIEKSDDHYEVFTNEKTIYFSSGMINFLKNLEKYTTQDYFIDMVSSIIVHEIGEKFLMENEIQNAHDLITEILGKDHENFIEALDIHEKYTKNQINNITELQSDITKFKDNLKISQKMAIKLLPKVSKYLAERSAEKELSDFKEIVFDINGKNFNEIQTYFNNLKIENKMFVNLILVGDMKDIKDIDNLTKYIDQKSHGLINISWVIGKSSYEVLENKNFKFENNDKISIIKMLSNGYLLGNGAITEKILTSLKTLANKDNLNSIEIEFLLNNSSKNLKKEYFENGEPAKNIRQIILGKEQKIENLEAKNIINKINSDKINVISRLGSDLVLNLEYKTEDIQKTLDFTELNIDESNNIEILENERIELDGIDEKDMKIYNLKKIFQKAIMKFFHKSKLAKDNKVLVNLDKVKAFASAA